MHHALRLTLLTSTAVLGAQAIGQLKKVNGPLARGDEIVGHPHEFAPSPDGTYVAYRSDELRDGVLELFVVPADGTKPPWVLPGSGLLINASHSFEVAPDSGRVVFLADDLHSARTELFVAPLDGSSAALRLSAELQPAGRVTSFALSADGSRAVYRADQDQDEAFELFTAPLDAGLPPVQLNGALVAGGDVWDFRISADSSRVVYLADAAAPGRYELYSVPIAGGAALRLNGTLAAGGNVGSFALSPDSARVAYLADQSANEVFELFAAPLDASAAARVLNAPLPAGGDVKEYRFAPDGALVVYTADQSLDETVELFRVPAAGGPPTALHPALVPRRRVSAFDIAPDGTTVVFSANLEKANASDLYAVPLTGRGPLVRLNPPSTWDQSNAWGRFTADSKRVVYVQSESSFGPFGDVQEHSELFSASVRGGKSPTLLTGAPTADGPIVSFEIAPDDGSVNFVVGHDGSHRYNAALEGSRPLAYLGFGFTPAHFTPDGARVLVLDEEARVVSRALDGGSSIVLSGEPLLGPVLGDVTAFKSAAGDRCVFVGNPGGLFAGHVRGPGSAGRLDPPDEGALIHRFAVDERGERVAFLREHALDRRTQLFGVRVDGVGGAVQLNPALGPSQFVSGEDVAGHAPQFTPDGSRVLFVRSAGKLELYEVPADGSAAAQPLTGALPAGSQGIWSGSEPAFRIGSDGARVVYSADALTPGVFELFSVPVDHSASAAKLSGTLALGADVNGRFLITPDAARVVYLADQDVRFRYELFSAPIDGVGPTLKLNAPLPAEGDVGGEPAILPYVALSPDGSRVVFWADQEVNDRMELFSVPADGSAAPVKLNRTPVPGGIVTLIFRITPDGTRVVYSADQDTDSVFELFSAPIDGSSPPVKVSGTMVAGGDAASLLRLEVPGRVVFLADRTTDGVDELYVAPLDGSSAPLRLNGSLVAGGDVVTFKVAPDGERVLYLADQELDDAFELYCVRADGGGVPERVNRDLLFGGDVMTDFEMTSDGGQILYRADQDEGEVFELYSRRTLRAASRPGRTTGPTPGITTFPF